MNRIENNNGTVTWNITYMRDSDSELEHDLARLNYNAVVIEKPSRYGNSIRIEFTVPLDIEGYALNNVVMLMQSKNYLWGMDAGHFNKSLRNLNEVS